MPIQYGEPDGMAFCVDVICDGDIGVRLGYKPEDIEEDDPTPTGVIFRQLIEKGKPGTVQQESDIYKDSPWVCLSFTSVESIDVVLGYLNHIKERMQEGELRGESCN